MQVNVNIEHYLKKKKDGTGDDFPKQPYLLLLKSSDSAISQSFVVVEYIAIPCKSVLKAFDLLYKCFYLFDLNYPQELESLYSFLDLIHDDVARASKSVREKFNLYFK